MNIDRINDAIFGVCVEPTWPKPRSRWTRTQVLEEASLCVLGSQVPHRMAVAALGRLRRAGLLPVAGGAPNQQQIAGALRTPLSREYPRAFRFPQLAAQRLAKLGAVAEAVLSLVRSDLDVHIARRGLVALKCGLGIKQSSLLLRNVRRRAELAVIDVHVIHFMCLVGLSKSKKAPSGLAEYEELESRFRGYAQGLRVPVDRLDVAVWVVMRSLSGRDRQWRS